MPQFQIDLEDNATDGLSDFNAALDQMSDNAVNAAKTADVLTAAQQRNIIVIERQRTNMYDMGKTYVSVFGDIATTGIRCFQEIEIATERFAAETTQTLIKSGASVLKYAIVTTGAVSGIKAVWGQHSKDVQDENAKQERSWESLGNVAVFAGKKVAASFLGLGPQMAGVSVGLSAYEGLLARTGIRTVELADGTKVLQSNLDRVSAAAGSAVGDVTRTLREAVDATAAIGASFGVELPAVWKEIDAATTRGADNLVTNIGLIRGAYNEGIVSSRAFAIQLTGGNAEAYRQEVKLLNEIQASFDNLTKRSEEARPALQRLGEANRQLEASANARAEMDRLNSINTVKGITAEINAMKDRRTAEGLNLKFSEEDQKQYVATIEYLEKRKTQVAQDEEKKRRDMTAQVRKALQEHYEETDKRVSEYVTRMNQAYDAEQKRIVNLMGLRRDLVNTIRNQEAQTGMAAAEKQHDTEKDMVAERMKLQGATETQIKTQLSQMDRQLTEANHALKVKLIDDEARDRLRLIQNERDKLADLELNDIDRRKQKTKLDEDEQKLRFERDKKRVEELGAFQRQMNAINLNDARQAEMAKFAAEKERILKARAEQDAANHRLKQQFNGQEFLNAQDPAKVMKQVQENRAQAAGQAAADQNADLWMKWNAGDKQAGRQYDKAVNSAMAKARRSAVNDAENGNLDQGEVTKAQSDVGQRTIDTLQNQGQITGLQGQAITENVQAIALIQQQQQQQAALISQLISAARGQKSIARQSMNALQAANAGLF